MKGLSSRYRNVSGTILVINDMNYLEIGVNGIIDLSLFSDDILNKSRGLREHIALNNLIPDYTEKEAMVILQQDFDNDTQVNADFMNTVIDEVSKKINNPIDIETIKAIAAEIGKEIAKNISVSSVENKDLVVEKTNNIKNDYETQIVNKTMTRMQDALEKKFPQVSEPPPVNEEVFNSEDVDASELKNLLKKSGG